MLQKIKAWLLKEYLEDLTYIDNRLIEFHDRLKSIESGVKETVESNLKNDLEIANYKVKELEDKFLFAAKTDFNLIESGVSKFGMKIAEDMKSFIKNSENTISKETNTFLSGVKEKL